MDKLTNLLGGLYGKTIGFLGLSFKPNFIDSRESPSLSLISRLQKERCAVRTYGPKAMNEAARILSDVTLCVSAYETADGRDALVLATDWAEFNELELSRLRLLTKQPILVDDRNVFDSERVQEAGLAYVGVGRGRQCRPHWPGPHPPALERSAILRRDATTAGERAVR